jgi:uncharacterized protein YndB with AHSA1/START domain
MRKAEAAITILQPSVKVFEAFTNPSLLQQWWGVERCLVEQKQGGLYSLAWNISKKGIQYISTGVITVFIPGKELLIDHLVYFNPEKPILGPVYLDIRFREEENSTHVQLVQGGYQEGKDWDWYLEAVKEAWPRVLLDLKNSSKNKSG